jgi:hypothetical protein
MPRDKRAHFERPVAVPPEIRRRHQLQVVDDHHLIPGRSADNWLINFRNLALMSISVVALVSSM